MVLNSVSQYPMTAVGLFIHKAKITYALAFRDSFVVFWYYLSQNAYDKY